MPINHHLQPVKSKSTKTMKAKLNLIQIWRPSLALPAIASLVLLLQNVSAQQWTANELPPGLIAWWPAENNLLDVVGGHDGAADSSVTYAPGRFGQAFHFDGAGTQGQSVRIPDGYADLDGWTQFTLEAWVYFDVTADVTPGPGRCIFSKVGSPVGGPNIGYQFGFYDNASRMFCQFNTNGQVWPGLATVANLRATVPTNIWLHAAATYDHSAVKLFLNGVPLVTNVVGPATIADSPSNLRISKDDNNNAPFGGRIDDARIYNRALSAAEIAYLYAGPNPPVTNGIKLRYDASNVNGDGSNPADGAAVNLWRDVGGLGLDLTPPVFPGNTVCLAPVYRADALNGRAGVDFSQVGSDALASAYSSLLNFTNCTILMVANGAGLTCHMSISASCINQEFAIGDKAIYHHAYPYHYSYRSHQDSPTNYYVQAGVFGVQSSQLDNWINGVLSTNGFGLGQESPTLGDVPDFAPVGRQAILGWRNGDAYCNAPIALENLGGVICEVLVYDRQLTAGELDAMNSYLAGKYNLAVTPIPPVLQVVSVAGGSVTLQWASTAGRQYQLQSGTNLLSPGWINEGTPFIGTGGVLLANVSIGSEAEKFFRLQMIGN